MRLWSDQNDEVTVVVEKNLRSNVSASAPGANSLTHAANAYCFSVTSPSGSVPELLENVARILREGQVSDENVLAIGVAFMFESDQFPIPYAYITISAGP